MGTWAGGAATELVAIAYEPAVGGRGALRCIGLESYAGGSQRATPRATPVAAAGGEGEGDTVEMEDFDWESTAHLAGARSGSESIRASQPEVTGGKTGGGTTHSSSSRGWQPAALPPQPRR